MDSEKFESTLLKMEAAIREQQQEINKLQAVYQEALQMRDNTKSVLSKQEQTTIASNKQRERQAAEFRRQVEDRKTELERLERKIFATGTKIIHQVDNKIVIKVRIVHFLSAGKWRKQRQN